MTANPKIERLRKMREQAQLGGGLKRIETQHSSGRLTARERLSRLLDPGTFHELDAFRCSPNGDSPNGGTATALGEGVVIGWGNINGRLTYVYAQDFTVMAGTLSKPHAEKICKIMELALRNGAPVIGLCDSGGARIQGGVISLAGYGDIFLLNTMASGVIPQLTAIMGPSAGGACYSPALTDFIFMVKNSSYMFVTGPQVVKAVTFEEVDSETLGGAAVHNSTSGVAQFMADDEEHCLSLLREMLSYIPQNNTEAPPAIAPSDNAQRMDEELNTIVPDDPAKPYDMREVLRRIVDNGEFFEIQSMFAPNIVIGFARLNGKPVGILANQPKSLAGALDVKASTKGARFVRFCDAFNIPIITFEDVPGFLPGLAQEHSGIIRNGAKLLYACCEATVPRITVICRKAYGGAYLVLNSRHVGADLVFAWPGAEIAVMGPEAAVNIIYRKELEQSDDPVTTRRQITQEYKENISNPYIAATAGYVDEVIEPKETRPRLIAALEMLANKRHSMPKKKHGNMPL